jgi:hypothetical protein
MKWKLVDYKNREVAFDTVVTTLIGSKFLLVSGEPPRHPASSGRVYVKMGECTSGFFPHVFNLRWEETT